MNGKLFKNPYVIAGAIGLAILAAYSLSSGGGTSSGGLSSQSIATGANVSLAGLTTQQNVNTENDLTAVALGNQQLQSNTITSVLGYLSNLSSNLTALNVARVNAQTQVTVNGQTTQAYEAVAPVLAKISADQAVAQTEISGATSQAIAASNAAASQAIASSYASVARQQATGSTLGGIGGLIGGIAKAIPIIGGLF